MITDDHKTHLPASALAHTAALAGNDAKPIEASAPFRTQPEQVAATPQIVAPNYPPTTSTTPT